MNFNWKEKMFLIILLCVLFTALSFSFHPKPAEKMQIFPSYDWGSEEEEVLAYISANTEGTDKDKQQAVIDCLDYVWNANHHFDIPEYASAKYKFYVEPTQHDYELIRLVKKGQWATDD